MIKQYIVENSDTFPLCCVEKGIYFNYLNGQVVDNPNVLKFIKEGLQRETMKVEIIDLVIYKIKEWKYLIYKDYPEDPIVGYKYIINGYSNYLDENKQLLTNDKKQYIIDKLMKGEYKQVLIWE